VSSLSRPSDGRRRFVWQRTKVSRYRTVRVSRVPSSFTSNEGEPSTIILLTHNNTLLSSSFTHSPLLAMFPSSLVSLLSLALLPLSTLASPILDPRAGAPISQQTLTVSVSAAFLSRHALSVTKPLCDPAWCSSSSTCLSELCAQVLHTCEADPALRLPLCMLATFTHLPRLCTSFNRRLAIFQNLTQCGIANISWTGPGTVRSSLPLAFQRPLPLSSVRARELTHPRLSPRFRPLRRSRTSSGSVREASTSASRRLRGTPTSPPTRPETRSTGSSTRSSRPPCAYLPLLFQASPLPGRRGLRRFQMFPHNALADFHSRS
jgi:hypothetical protein